MTTCKPTFLFDQEHFCIAQCQHCQRVGLTYRNLLLSFSQDEFVKLCRTIDGINFTQDSLLLADGQPHLIINTGHPDIQFSLLEAEFELLRTGLMHALRRLNLYQLLKIQVN